MTSAVSIAQGGTNNVSFRNRIINGAMMIDQRNNGASQTITAGTTPYTVDRWIGYFGGGNGISQRVGSVGAYSLQFTGGAGVTGFQTIQRIESNNIADCAGQTVTLSFTVSSSTQTSVGLYYNTPTAQDNFTSLNSTGTISGSVPLTATPTRLSYTFTLPSNATNGFQFFFQLGTFTSGTFTITGVQLEAGTTATPFENRLYGTELALCQRYCQLIGTQGVFGSFYNTTAACFSLNLAATMRSTPAASFPSGAYTNAVDQIGVVTKTPTALAVLYVTPNLYSFTATGMSGATLGNPANWLGSPFVISAEL